MLCIFIAAATLPVAAFAQIIPLDEGHYTDSLENRLNSKIPDTERAQIHFLLSDYWSQYDSAKAKKILDSGLQFIDGDIYTTALYNFSLANYYFDRQDFDRSAAFYKKADSLLLAVNDRKTLRLRASIWKAYAAIRQRKDDEKGFLDYLMNKSIPLAEQARDSNLIGLDYVTVGLAFTNKLEYKKAAEYYQKGIALIKKSSPPSVQTLIYANNHSAGNYVEMDSLPMAKQQLDETKNLLRHFPESRYAIDYYYNTGYYFQHKKDYDSVLALYNKSIAVAEKYHEDYKKQRSQFLKYVVYRYKKDYHRAVNILLNIINHNLFPTTNNRLTLYHEISDTYVLMKKMPEAYEWLNQYTELRDSL